MTYIDYIIVVVYMGVVITAGLMSRGKQDSAEDYFASSGTMKGLLGMVMVGLSIAATFFSGISFVAIPSIVIDSGTKIFLIFGSLIPCSLLVYFWFIPRYMEYRSFHPYEIIASRMGENVRTITSALYVLLRIGWMASLIYAPTIVLLTVMKLGNEWTWPIIIIIGMVSTGYTVFSGLRGVVVTDAIQMLIILASLLFTFLFALSQIPMNPGDWFQKLKEKGMLTMPSFSLSMVERFTVWGVLVGISVSNLAMYIADQMSLQRYIATGDTKSAQRSFLYNMGGVVVVLGLLMMIGMVVLLWYSYHPQISMPDNPDRVFPAFVSTVLPSGLGGLMAAAILAATMSSITSGINALAGALTIDFIQPACPDAPPEFFLKVGRWLSLGIGLLCTIVAGFASRMGTIYDLTQAILGVFMGPILAVVLLAMSGRKCNPRHVNAGILISSAVGLMVAFSNIQSIWVTTFGTSTCLLIAWPYSKKI